jgi:hypothetical protein
LIRRRSADLIDDPLTVMGIQDLEQGIDAAIESAGGKPKQRFQVGGNRNRPIRYVAFKRTGMGGSERSNEKGVFF